MKGDVCGAVTCVRNLPSLRFPFCSWVHGDTDPRRAKKDVYMFAVIQKTSGATIALTNATYNYMKQVLRTVTSVVIHAMHRIPLSLSDPCPYPHTPYLLACEHTCVRAVLQLW